MIAIHLNTVKSVQKEFQKEIKKHRKNALLKLQKIAATSLNDQTYLSAVINLFTDNSDIITWSPGRLDLEMAIFPSVPLVINKDGNYIKSSIKDKVITALGYKNLRRNFYPKYFRELNIKSCVYCNSQLAITATKPNRSGLSARFDVDHYCSKDEFPFLSICLFNLYPACAPCNRSKNKNSNIEFALYSDEKDRIHKSKYKFSLESHSKAKYLISKDSNYLEFRFEEPKYSSGKRTFEEVFYISGIYGTQLDVIEELVVKSQIYNPSYIKVLRNNFSKLSLSPDLFKRALVGAYIKDREIHKRPLNKFVMDIAKDLELI